MHRSFAVLSFLLITLGYTHASAQHAEKTNTKQTTETDRLKLYPNPAKTYVNIYVDWKTVQPFSIFIYDMQYNTQLNEVKVGARKSYQYALDVTQLPAGKYKIKIVGSSQMEEILTVTK
jgi:hypothetical protein